MQAALSGVEEGDAICADLLTARWGEQAHSAVVDRGACAAFLPCLSWDAETSSEPLLSPAFTPTTSPLIWVHLFCVRWLKRAQPPEGDLCELASTVCRRQEKAL